MIMHAGEILKRRGLINQKQLEDSGGGDYPNVVQAAISLGYVSERDALGSCWSCCSISSLL